MGRRNYPITSDKTENKGMKLQEGEITVLVRCSNNTTVDASVNIREQERPAALFLIAREQALETMCGVV